MKNEKTTFEKPPLHGVSLIELLVFPGISIICLILFIRSLIMGNYGLLYLFTAVLLIFIGIIQVSRVPRIIIEITNDRIVLLKRGKSSQIVFGPTITVGVDRGPVGKEDEGTMITGIAISDGAMHISCYAIDGWSTEVLEQMWDRLSILVDQYEMQLIK